MPNIWASKSLVSTYPLFYSNLLYLDQVHLKEEHNVEPLLYKANNMYGDYVCQVSTVPLFLVVFLLLSKTFSPYLYPRIRAL
jgi:hypothetical protein